MRGFLSIVVVNLLPLNRNVMPPARKSINSVLRVVLDPNINGIENGLVNAKVNVIDCDRADLSVLAFAQILREDWKVTSPIEFKYVRDRTVLRLSKVGLAKLESDRLAKLQWDYRSRSAVNPMTVRKP